MTVSPLPANLPPDLLGEIRFDANGLVPAIAQQHDTGEVLMVAWMNAESVAETLATGRVCYFSRSRGKLWRKGETSGEVQTYAVNRAGGNGQLGLGELSRAAPDGYTLLTNNDGGIGLPPALDKNFRFTPVKDYAPIAQVVQADYILTARGGLPVKTVRELIDYAKAAKVPLVML